jgi:predicted extracellular nuclease
MNYLKITVFVFAVSFPFFSFSQEIFRIVSYNVENLFDCEDDSLTNDNSFTESGNHQWNPYKYNLKLQNVSKAITAAGGWEIPALIGLCEIENASVVNDLLEKTQLNHNGYCFLHQDSPDRRGIDVALIYHPEKFQVIGEKQLRVPLPDRSTRDILFATGIIPNGDTLHVFVNHWPSRYGGELESEPNRIIAAQTVKSVTDSLFLRNIHSNIVIMGDFNDYPSNRSITNILGAKQKWDTVSCGELYNLCARLEKSENIGSHKFDGKWGMLDQFIVSGNLLSSSDASSFTGEEYIHICNEPFLLKEDKTGVAPKRCFLGTFFTSGFSDHLPIRLDINVKTGRHEP